MDFGICPILQNLREKSNEHPSGEVFFPVVACYLFVHTKVKPPIHPSLSVEPHMRSAFPQLSVLLYQNVVAVAVCLLLRPFCGIEFNRCSTNVTCFPLHSFRIPSHTHNTQFQQGRDPQLVAHEFDVRGHTQLFLYVSTLPEFATHTGL